MMAYQLLSLPRTAPHLIAVTWHMPRTASSYVVREWDVEIIVIGTTRSGDERISYCALISAMTLAFFFFFCKVTITREQGIIPLSNRGIISAWRKKWKSIKQVKKIQLCVLCVWSPINYRISASHYTYVFVHFVIQRVRHSSLMIVARGAQHDDS